MRLTPLFSPSKVLFPIVVSSALLTVDSAEAANTTLLWNGLGVGSNTGSYWDASLNYTGTSSFSSTTDLDFSADNSTGVVTLSSTTNGTISVGNLRFATSANTNTNQVYINLNGNGTPGQTILNMGGSIYVPSPNGSVVKFGNDLTLNLSNAAHNATFVTNTSIPAVTLIPVLVVNSKITGGGASANFSSATGQLGLSGTTPVYGTPGVVLNNNSSTFDGTWTVGGMLSYTSINNTGAGAGTSSFGTAVSSSGSIGLKAGSMSYIGSGDQSTNRTVGIVATSGAINNYASSPSNLTLTGLISNANTGVATLNLGVSDGNVLTINGAIGNGTGAGVISVNKASGLSYFDANGILRSGNGRGLTILAGANTYTGTTTVSSGTLQVGTGGAASTGNLINSGGTYSALTFSAGGGTFRTSEASDVSQHMGALTFSSGDGTVESVNNGGNSTLSFTSLANASAGATGNFVVTNGVNGSTNSIVLTGQTAGVMGARYFFNGNSAGATYAYVDTSSGTPLVRAINYTTDAGAQNNTTGAQFTANSNVKVSTTNVTGLTTQTIKTLEIADASTVSLANNNTLTTSGILKTGGNASTITGGTIAVTSGTDLVIRVDQASDFLTINSKLSINGGLTKSGLGTLRLTSANTTFGKSSYLNGGWLQVASGALPNGYALYFNGGNLEFLGATGISGATNPALTFNESGTIKSDLGTVYLSQGITLNTNTMTVTGDGGVLETGVISGAGSITKTGKGTLSLAGVNTYTGATTVKEGSVTVDFTATSSGSTNTASNYISNNSNVILAGGSLDVLGRANGGNVSGGGSWTGTTTRPNLTFAGGVPAGLVVGQAVSGTGIPAGAYIVAIVGNMVTISANVTATSGNDLTASATTVNTSQTIASTTVSSGASGVSVNNNNSNGSVLNLGNINRSTGATVNITLPTGTQTATNGITTTTANGSNGILGGYATVGGSTWAVSGGNGSTAGNITGLSSYGTDYATADSSTNFDATGSGSLTNSAVNSLRFNSAAPVAVTLNGAATIASGGILVTSAVGNNASSISGGTSLTSGNGTDLIVQQNNTSAALTIDTKVTGAIGLTKSGAGDLVLAGNNDYTGGTYINAGKVIVTGGIHGSLVNMASGSTLDVFGTLTAGNDGTLTPVAFTLEGTASINFETGSKLALNLGAEGAASTVSFTTLGDWLSGSGNATLQLSGAIDYSSTYKVFSNVDTLFSFSNVTNYDTSHYLAQVSMVGNDEVLSFTAVPEPSTWAMMVGGLGMLLMGRKIRRRTI